MGLSRFSRFLLLTGLLGTGAGALWLWNYVDDLTHPILVPVNPSYEGFTQLPQKAAGLQLEPFSFKGADGIEVPAMVVTRAARSATGEDDSTSRQLSVAADLAVTGADRLGALDYVLLCVDWDHGIRSALPLAESLTAAGLTCVLWEPRGKDSARPHCTHGLRESRDIPLLIDALAARSQKAEPVIVGIGRGFGASLLLHAAAGEPRLRGLVSIDAFASLRESVERTLDGSSLLKPVTVWLMDRKMSGTVGFECFDVAPVESAARLDRDVPALVVSLAQDNPVTQLKDALTIYRQLPSDKREVWALRDASDPEESLERELAFTSGLAEKRREEKIRVGLVNDEDSAVISIIHWLNDCVVEAVETPHVVTPARPRLHAGSQL